MIELVQFEWSPYCLVTRRILEFGGAPHQITNIPPSDRSLIWRMTRQRYYQVPVIKDGRSVVFETDENSQVIAKYLDARFQLGLFPPEWEGIQRIVWRYIENDVEGLTFKLNDAHYRQFVPPAEQLNYLRFKERKFGRGCLQQWAANRKQLIAELVERLIPFEQMLATHPFLLDDRPRFVDFDLWGMLANFLYSGQYRLPRAHPRLRRWFTRMKGVKFGAR
ncbi:MAG TPA: glutathione S-transferase family protein [Methylomirabilota bacterium]|nr:glutathione S-transferase family protein [Methylomirabilota bacterium]